MRTSFWPVAINAADTLLLSKLAAPIPSMTIPRLAAADGNPAKVEWSKATELAGPWFMHGRSEHAPRKLSGRIAQDGEFLYR